MRKSTLFSKNCWWLWKRSLIEAREKVGIDFEMVARNLRRWALLTRLAELHLASLFEARTFTRSKVSTRWIILYREATISRKKIVRGIPPNGIHLHIEGPPQKHRTNVHVIRPNPPCSTFQKQKCNAHLISSYPLKLSIATVSSLSFSDLNFHCLDWS